MLPGISPRFGNIFVGAVGEADRVQALSPQLLDVARAVVDVDIRAHLFFLFHEAQVPIRDAVPVEPVDGLFHRGLMKKVNVEPMGDDADAGAVIGELAQVSARAGYHRRGFEQFALGHREAVQAVVLLDVFDVPLAQSIESSYSFALPRGEYPSIIPAAQKVLLVAGEQMMAPCRSNSQMLMQ